MPTEKKYKIIPTKKFLKDLSKIEPHRLSVILAQKNQLAINPYIGKKLTSVSSGQWRIRVGNYRIRYDIDNEKVVLMRIMHRKDIYKKFISFLSFF